LASSILSNNLTAPTLPNLEVGDPLTGIYIPTVTMPNGFTYHLQELAFFSWFYGAPSIGSGGLFSDNGTFKTDAGPVCQ
jgi:hypothetical protein